VLVSEYSTDDAYPGGSDKDAIYPGDGIQNGGAIKLALASSGLIIDEVELGDGPGSPRLPELNGRLDQSYQRIDGGCTDTDSAADFAFMLVSTPSAQVASVTADGCWG
jgi:hypothetical protein